MKTVAVVLLLTQLTLTYGLFLGTASFAAL